MVQPRVFDEDINFAFMYITPHIFPVLPINHLVTQDGEPATSHKLATSMKSLVSNICILFSFVVQKATTHL